MRRYIFVLITIFLGACNAKTTEKTPKKSVTIEEKSKFFPVTSYIKGQIHDIFEKGLTPIKYTITKKHTDSVLIKFAELNDLLKEFLDPKIDSANFIPYFTETKFLDQTINAFTFTYDPKPGIPDSIAIKHWDVYIDPETNKVQRVYLIKKSGRDKTLQLTWQSNKCCKTTTIITSADGQLNVEKEEKIVWDY
jgi:hypothetical protein